MCVLVSISPVGLPIVSAINYGLAQGTYKYHISTIYSLAIERDTKFLYSIMRNNLDLVHQVEHSILGAISWQRKAHKIQWYETNCRKIKLGGGEQIWIPMFKLLKMLLSIYSQTRSLITQKATIPSPKSLSVTGPLHDSFPTDLPSSQVHSPR